MVTNQRVNIERHQSDDCHLRLVMGRYTVCTDHMGGGLTVSECEGGANDAMEFNMVLLFCVGHWRMFISIDNEVDGCSSDK
jgi:hypothetical protein